MTEKGQWEDDDGFIMQEWKSYSRFIWGCSKDEIERNHQLSRRLVELGCLQRIAASLESIARSLNKMAPKQKAKKR